MADSLQKFEDQIEVYFEDKDLLRQVFVHRSFLNENPDFKLDHNERLEFLGDAVLELVVTEFLYKNYNKPEGELTNLRSALVKGEMLAKVAASIDMNDHLYLSHGESKSGGRSRQIILANAFEALIGAMYLDQGMEKVRTFIGKNILPKLPEILEKGLYLDAKSKLQEVIQEKEGVTPTYRVLAESGPDHDKTFSVGVFVGERMAGEGQGSSKQSAEQAAAAEALKAYIK
jgi:ribonuclease-3